MMSHEAFVFLSYGASAVTLAGLLAAILLDGRARRRELAELEAQGVRRRSKPAGGAS
ncbi:heme exporter protein D [Hoeflea halophila]|uniref:Heme exporter protein D n=1 Tax=Hoeflea halophila TaxID=714899 RepID=A0A286I9W6_9HYPH|nr:heme exporter protein CcmD [Hoeflea halophila]SOE16852.1 heme exporter protein D [Hoeflea halophila]